ncbi:MAG: hypothetical protein NXI20_22620 [bacterium]|nr:hypothetical protein [bacterium]
MKQLIKIFLLAFSISLIANIDAISQDDIKVELKDAPKPDIYIDGKKYDYSIFELLDQSKIASVNVIKDDDAINKYNAPNGVILITTKKNAEQQPVKIEKDKVVVADGKGPIIYINGKLSSKEDLQKLSPKKIETINVIKGETAIEKYNAPNGVIVVKTKN